MKSKEALERVKQAHYTAMACLGIEKPDIETEKAINIIKKDLEVLDILKKYIRAGQWSNEYTLLSWEMKSKELTKIKEWLKEEEK